MITTLTNQQALDMAQGIAALDGSKQHKLSVQLRFRLAQAKLSLSVALKPMMDLRDNLVNNHSGGIGKIDPGTLAHANFQKDFAILAAQQISCELPRLLLEDLCLQQNEDDGNPIPIWVLATLCPIIPV